MTLKTTTYTTSKTTTYTTSKTTSITPYILAYPKIYKPTFLDIFRIFPGDLTGSPDDFFSGKLFKLEGEFAIMEETLVFVDEGLLKELVEHFGDGKRLKFDKFEFAKRLAKKQGLFCKHLFYYTCPPFQSDAPTEDEANRKKGHDKFVNALSKNKDITIREGRCQRLKNEEGKFEYHQKEVDNLLTIDMGHIKDDFPDIKKIILVSSDTDFCPSIKDVRKRNSIEVILYTYFDRERKSKFSLSNELIACCSNYFKLTKEDFTSCPIKKRRNKKC